MPSYFGAVFSFLAAFCRFPAQESQAYRAAIVDGAGVSSLAICGLSLTMRTTVPFNKIGQRHGQKVGANGVCDRAF